MWRIGDVMDIEEFEGARARRITEIKCTITVIELRILLEMFFSKIFEKCFQKVKVSLVFIYSVRNYHLVCYIFLDLLLYYFLFDFTYIYFKC